MHRKLIILSMLIAIAFKATAQQQQIPYYTILLGQTKEWKTGSTIKSIAKGGNAECVKITFQGATANIKGMKLGLVELTATLSNGKTQKCKVRVTTSAPKTKWTGRYELKIPKDNWHIAYKNLGTGQMTRAGRIGNVFANVEDLGDEGGLVYNRFYYNLRAGYKAFSKDPKFQHCDDAGDIDGFASEYYFREFGPKNADESFVDGGWELVEFGYINTSDDGMNGDLMQTFHAYSWPTSRLEKYYAGDETVCGIKCWKFDTRKRPPSGSMGSCYWIDPSNGLCLKRLLEDGSGFEVTIYDLDYHNWTPDIFPDGFK